MRIVSPMPTGNGAYIVHKTLEQNIRGYEVVSYSPYLTLFPPALPFVARRQADIIHTVPDYAIFHRRKGAQLVVTFQNYVLDKFMRRYSSPAQRLHYRTDLRYFTEKAIRCADIITTVSCATADLIKNDLGYDREIVLIENGVDTNMFSPTVRPAGSSIKVLFSGNPTRRKGADLLPAIADQIDSGITLYYTSGLRNIPVHLGRPNIVPLGRVPHAEMPSVYQEMDILLMPTVREGLSLSAMEAMASGLPVVCSDLSSMPELIIDGAGGYCIPDHDPSGYAHVLNRLAASHPLRQKMGEYNRNRVLVKFDQRGMIDSYRKLFSSLQ